VLDPYILIMFSLLTVKKNHALHIYIITLVYYNNILHYITYIIISYIQLKSKNLIFILIVGTYLKLLEIILCMLFM